MGKIQKTLTKNTKEEKDTKGNRGKDFTTNNRCMPEKFILLTN
jgi:hypothetical protein